MSRPMSRRTCCNALADRLPFAGPERARVHHQGLSSGIYIGTTPRWRGKPVWGQKWQPALYASPILNPSCAPGWTASKSGQNRRARRHGWGWTTGRDGRPRLPVFGRAEARQGAKGNTSRRGRTERRRRPCRRGSKLCRDPRPTVERSLAHTGNERLHSGGLHTSVHTPGFRAPAPGLL